MKWLDDWPDTSDGEWYGTPEPDDELAPDWDWVDDDDEDADDAE